MSPLDNFVIIERNVRLVREIDSFAKFTVRLTPEAFLITMWSFTADQHRHHDDDDVTYYFLAVQVRFSKFVFRTSVRWPGLLLKEIVKKH